MGIVGKWHPMRADTEKFMRGMKRAWKMEALAQAIKTATASVETFAAAVERTRRAGGLNPMDSYLWPLRAKG